MTKTFVFDGINGPLYREHIKNENLAYDKLIQHGYTPQGATKDFKQVVVAKIYDIEHKELYYYDSWQQASEDLCKSESEVNYEK